MGAWFDDFPNKFKGKNFQDLLDYLKKFPTPEEFSLDISYIHVVNLIEFIPIIDNNSNQLKNPYALEDVKKKIRPSAILLDYIILEINNFYTKVHSMKKKGKPFPEIPKYWNILKEYRNISPAHRDRDHKLKNLADYTSHIKKLDSIGIPKIVEDFMKYYAEIKKDQSLKNTF